MQTLTDDKTVNELPGTIVGYRFYNETGVWLEVEDWKLRDGVDDVEELVIGPVRNARVANLEKLDNFTLKTKNRHGVGYLLYVYAKTTDLKTNVLQREDDESKSYANVFKVPLKCRTRYDREWRTELTLWKYNHTERTAFGKRVDVMAKMLTLEGLEEVVERGQTAKLLRLYDLSRKVSAAYYVSLKDDLVSVDLATAYEVVKHKAGYRNVHSSTDGQIILEITERFLEQFGKDAKDRIRGSNYEGWNG